VNHVIQFDFSFLKLNMDELTYSGPSQSHS